jgi:hypothetical protein
VNVAERDTEVVAAQLGRCPRGVREIACRCPCGLPCVIETVPRLDDGVPFPTLFYLTCRKAVAAIGTLEASGEMKRMADRLDSDAGLRQAYQAAHRDYLDRRDAAGRAEGLEPLPAGTQSAGGMPERVKCLHALAAHELAVPGTNPFGREALAAIGQWWLCGPCVGVGDETGTNGAAAAGKTGANGAGAAARS